IVLVKFPADRGQTVDHQEKVERVKHPAEESCGDCFSVIVRRRAQEAHSLSITVLSKSAQRFNSAMGTFSPVLCAVSISPGPNTTVSELSAPRCGASVPNATVVDRFPVSDSRSDASSSRGDGSKAGSMRFTSSLALKPLFFCFNFDSSLR